MIKVGITGGIGSGKSYVCHLLHSMGYPIYICDEEAKRLMNESHIIREKLTKLIGDDAYLFGEEGEKATLNKPVVARFLFANAHNAQQINSIVHPVVKKDFAEWADRQYSDIVFQESAILFESGFDATVDKTVEVYAPHDIRLARAMYRDNASKEQIESRMAMQMNEEEKRKLADFCIINDGEEDLLHQIDELIQSLLVENNKGSSSI